MAVMEQLFLNGYRQLILLNLSLKLKN